MKRPANNKNIFRALCEINNRLCVVQSKNVVQFKDFVALLQQLGASEALYLEWGQDGTMVGIVKRMEKLMNFLKDILRIAPIG